MASYTRVNWQNKAAGGTKLGAINLNVMDAGIDDLYTIFDAAGDLLTASAADTPARLAIGSNDEVLSVNSGALDYRKIVAAMTDFAFASYTPTWTGTSTNPAIGNGTETGKYLQLGKLVIGWFLVTAGSTSTYGSGGVYQFAMPVATALSTKMPLGVARVIGGATEYIGLLTAGSGNTFRIAMSSAAVTGDEVVVTPTAPMSPASGDSWGGLFFYEAS